MFSAPCAMFTIACWSAKFQFSISFEQTCGSVMDGTSMTVTDGEIVVRRIAESVLAADGIGDLGIVGGSVGCSFDDCCWDFLDLDSSIRLTCSIFRRICSG